MVTNGSLKQRVRAGIIGPQGIGAVHVAALRRIGVEVAAVAASTEASARRHAARLEVARSFADPHALIHSPDIDTVHICTPNSLHAPLCREALAAGKHVICEKPLATSLADARDLSRLARQAGVVNAVCYVYRYFTMPRLMRTWAASGKLGRVHLIHGSFLLDEILTQADPRHWMLDPTLIGPSLSLADIGVHWWDLVEFVSGQRVVEVVGATQAIRGSDERSDDSDAIMMRLDGGALASAVISQAAPGHTTTLSLELVGTLAGAAWTQEAADTLWYGPLARPPEVIRRPDPADQRMDPRAGSEPEGRVQDAAEAFAEMMAAIYAPIFDSGAHSAYPSFADGVHGMEILAAVLKSAAERRWIAIDGH
ncbi:MAG TPA: Gfo/Idh/MocA family oxidoreductase [Chloroflexota bacterium]|nr:Gfo/Idh/MocA family oxidoreductase [Chloroflexota bacterium]